MRKSLVSWLLALYWVLGSWKGYVAIYNPGETEPWQIYPRKIADLTPEQQTLLAEGITIRNERDLNGLLEDFLS